MRAAWYEKTGPARSVLEIGEMPRPDPGPGEVRVRLHASGVNPSDTKRRAGWRGAPIEFPRIVPHSDGAGTIEGVGSGVGSERVGERVWVYNAQYERPMGTAADFVVLPEAYAVRLPERTSFAEGACLGIPAQTAHRAVFADGPVTGQTILVAGGAGAVGHYAVQFAAWGGARVVTTVSGDAKAAHARAAGATEIVNYREEDVTARIMALTDGQGVDRIVEVDFGANLALDTSVVRQNGIIASYSSTRNAEPVLPYYALGTRGVTIRLVGVYVLPPEAQQAACADITKLLEAGRLTNAIAGRFPLSDIAAAHEAVESGTIIGNVMVEIDNSDG